MKSLSLTLTTLLIICITGAIACSPQNNYGEEIGQNTQKRDSVIWDQDTREDISAFDSDIEQIQATAMFITKSRLQKEDGFYTYENYTVQSRFQLCANEHFNDQTSLGHCSGVLISPNQVLTAGHCVKDEKVCEDTYLTFGFGQYKSFGKAIDGNEVYSCKKIVKLELNQTRDYAIIELDRNVQQASPVKIGRADELKVKDEVTSLSYPLGIPLKRDAGIIKETTPGGFYMKVKVDTFSGSSGSPLFNNRHELVGILATGTQDYDEIDAYHVRSGKHPNICIKIKRCTDNECSGERFLKVEGIEFPQ